MEPQDSTLTDALRSNATVLMGWRNITPAQLGRRMAALGFDGWRHHKTAIRFLTPTPQARKSVSPDELMGLALTLDTTIDVLLTGNLEGAEVNNYAIGDFAVTARDAKLRTYNETADSFPRSNSTHGVLWDDDTPLPHATLTSMEEGLAQIREMLISAEVATSEELDGLPVEAVGALMVEYLSTLPSQEKEAR